MTIPRPHRHQHDNTTNNDVVHIVVVITIEFCGFGKTAGDGTCEILLLVCTEPGALRSVGFE